MKDLYQKAITAYQNDEYQRAVELFERILEEYPDHNLSRKARYELGQLYLYKLKQPQKALKHLQDLYAQSDPGKYSLEALKLIGHIYETSLNSCLEGIEAYRLLIQDYASNPDVNAAEYQFAIAECYFKLNEYQLALVEYEMLVELYPHSDYFYRARFQIANIYALQEDWDQAIALHEELMQNSRLPEQLSADNKLELAFCYEQNERFEEALLLYEELLVVDSENVVIDLSLVDRRITRAKEAVEASKKGPGKVDWKRKKK
jgi:tetratricopeptide (TPR) repeat protein